MACHLALDVVRRLKSLKILIFPSFDLVNIYGIFLFVRKSYSEILYVRVSLMCDHVHKMCLNLDFLIL